MGDSGRGLNNKDEKEFFGRRWIGSRQITRDNGQDIHSKRRKQFLGGFGWVHRRDVKKAHSKYTLRLVKIIWSESYMKREYVGAKGEMQRGQGQDGERTPRKLNRSKWKKNSGQQCHDGWIIGIPERQSICLFCGAYHATAWNVAQDRAHLAAVNHSSRAVRLSTLIDPRGIGKTGRFLLLMQLAAWIQAPGALPQHIPLAPRNIWAW